MRLTLAPMEGLTAAAFRRRHSEIFGGADLYYTPFITPTEKSEFTPKQMKELAPEVNRGLPVIPQLLTRNAANFRWAAKALADLGYEEVNLNFGCPMGTVTAKGRGSGILRDPLYLRDFLDQCFETEPPLSVSVKTRLGWASESEFEDLAAIYSRYPLKELIIHARLRNDFYRGDPRTGCFLFFQKQLSCPVGYNGDVHLVSQIRDWEKHSPALSSLMIGRAAVANPAIFRQAKGGSAASADEILAFHNALQADYTASFGSVNNTVAHMKQYWFYMKNLFEGGDRLFKQLLKAKKASEYEAAVAEIVQSLPMRGEPVFGWWKPAAD